MVIRKDAALIGTGKCKLKPQLNSIYYPLKQQPFTNSTVLIIDKNVEKLELAYSCCGSLKLIKRLCKTTGIISKYKKALMCIPNDPHFLS